MIAKVCMALVRALPAWSDARLPLRPSSAGLIKRLLRDHVKRHAWRLAFALLLMALAAAATAMLAKLMEPVLDEVFTAHNSAKLWQVAVAVLIMFVVKGAATYGQATAMNHVGQRIVADIQADMLRHILKADLAYFHATSTGNLVSRFTNDVNLLRSAASTTITGIGKDALTLVFLVGMMFYQDWLLALVTFIAFPLAFLPILRIGRRMRKVSLNTQVEMGLFTTLLDQVFQGARHVKAYGMEAHEERRGRAVVERLFTLAVKSGRARTSRPLMEFISGVAIVGVILYGGTQVIHGYRTTGTFFSFITAFLLAYEPVKRLASLNASLQEGLAAAQRVFELLDAEPSIRDAPGAVPLEVSRGEVRFNRVWFRYGEALPPALRDLSLVIPAGRTTALVGPSGAGKSTVLNLIPRFYDVAAGEVTIDGQEVRAVTLASLRAKLALVSQEISLFDDTVRANIAYGRPNASDDEIIAAARHAAAHAFITELPHGYDTFVGEHGIRLSGGQRQRIAIARAILKDAPILLLDEATSALDTESERLVQSALRFLMRGRTTLVIAHRLSTVIDADNIYVIDSGQLVESGSHAELLVRGGAYARLYRLQFAEQERAAAAAAAAGAENVVTIRPRLPES